MKKTAVFLMVLMLVGLVTACATDEVAETTTAPVTTQEATTEAVTEAATEAATTEEAAMPPEKSFDFVLNGESLSITVPYEPQRVVVIGYDVLDIVDALGKKDVVVGVPDPASPIWPAFLEGYESLTSVGSLTGDDLEAIAGLKPDLIIAGQRAMLGYEALTEIAPTAVFMIPGLNPTMNFEDTLYNNIDNIAYLLNVEEKAEALTASLKEDIETLRTTIGGLENKKAMVLITTGKSINMYTDNEGSRYGFVYHEFGFAPTVNMEEVAVEDKKVNDGEASRHGNSVSLEFISAKNPDVILVIDRGTIIGQSDVPASDTLDNPLVASTMAAKNGNIIYLDGASWYLATGGVTATGNMLGDIHKNLKE